MKVAVWDTYVKRDTGIIMHFDILVPENVKDKEKIFNFGKAYLASKPFKNGKLSTKECQYCHIEEASKEIESLITKNGFYIIEMENCN